MSGSLTQAGGNNRIYTPPPLARAIVRHFNPAGSACDPCMGKRAFINALDATECTEVVGFEIDHGTDFLAYSHPDPSRFQWIITNPPWGKPFFRQFLVKSMEVADNVVFLCCTNALFYNGRYNDIEKAGFGIKEIAMVYPVPSAPWPSSGFRLSANHLQRGWTGDTKFSKINWSEGEEDFWG
jgi:hypothetical protein